MAWIWISEQGLPGDMAACLAGVAGLGVGSSLLQSSLTGLAGVLPAYVIGATMAGQGVAGVLGAVVSLVPQTFNSVGAIFWGANLTMLATLPVYWRHFRFTPEVRE